MGWPAMRMIADTNVLVRAAIEDDPRQSIVALEIMRSADAIVISLVTFCEFAWVLHTSYRKTKSDVAFAIRLLIDVDNVVCDKPSVEAGLVMLDAGGDFADGAIASDGRRLGGEIFASFDKKAIGIFEASGGHCLLLSGA